MTSALRRLSSALEAEVVLDRAIPLYWMFGRADVPLPVLASETGLPEAVLAELFGDAAGAFRAALARYAEGPAADPWRAFAAAPDGQEAAAFAAALQDLVFEDGVGRGCLLVLTIARFAPGDAALEAAVAAHVAALMALAGPPREARPPPRRLMLAHAEAAARARRGETPARVAAAVEALLFPSA